MPFEVHSLAASNWTSFRRGMALAGQGLGCPSDTWVWWISARYMHVLIVAGDYTLLAIDAAKRQE